MQFALNIKGAERKTSGFALSPFFLSKNSVGFLCILS